MDDSFSTDPTGAGTPVLFLVFNRPEQTQLVFNAIRKARPATLYVAADGPRPTRAGEQERCAEVRRLATLVDWPCELHTLFRSENLGCRRAVSSAIDWFFEQEHSGIILEDDCLPDPSWFRFSDELLKRYQDDERIMCIAASHLHGPAHDTPDSYFFSRHNHCWGWASWRRAWQHYDHDMQAWPHLRDTDWLLGIGNGNALFQRYWTRIFDIAKEGVRVDSWAYRWTFSCWSQSGITILPGRNLVTNIGLGGDSTHTSAGLDQAIFQRLESIDFPLRHPRVVVPDVAADRWSDRYVFGITHAKDWRVRIRSLGIVQLVRSALKGQAHLRSTP